MHPSESAFQEAVIDLARLHGWLVYHARPAQIRPGRWATPFTGDPGFPDLCLVHHTRGALFAELKSGTGRPTDAQVRWIATLQAAGCEAYIWWPHQMPLIADRLAQPRQEPAR